MGVNCEIRLISSIETHQLQDQAFCPANPVTRFPAAWFSWYFQRHPNANFTSNAQLV